MFWLKNLSNEELTNTTGGGWKTFALIGVGLFVLAAGIVDGYVRPLRCR